MSQIAKKTIPLWGKIAAGGGIICVSGYVAYTNNVWSIKDRCKIETTTTMETPTPETTKTIKTTTATFCFGKLPKNTE